ncbi:AAA ATPase central domain-containing protein [Nostoc linckia NIES-25]|nr:AAA ATPase central domain-containing protein [Nostoc linckia NIES-25]
MSNFHQNGKGDSTHSRENQQYASLIEQLDLMIRARYPLVYVISVEEEPVEEVLFQVASRSVPQRQILFWDIVRGWSDNGADKGSVMAALGRIGKADSQTAAMFVLRDLHPFIKNPTTEKNAPIVRELRNLTRELK